MVQKQMSIPTEKRLAKELEDIALANGTWAQAAWKKQAQYVRRLMKAHGAAMYKKGQIS